MRTHEINIPINERKESVGYEKGVIYLGFSSTLRCPGRIESCPAADYRQER